MKVNTLLLIPFLAIANNVNGQVNVDGDAKLPSPLVDTNWRSGSSGYVPPVVGDSGVPMVLEVDRFPFPPPESLLESESIRLAYVSAIEQYYRYRSQSFTHRQLVFEWQFYSTIVIFVVVLLLVALGIYFSWIQFSQTMGRMRKGDLREDQEVTQLKATLTSVEIASPVLGVIILALSLAFLYLYLVHVYPIHEVH